MNQIEIFLSAKNLKIHIYLLHVKKKLTFAKEIFTT